MFLYVILGLCSNLDQFTPSTLAQPRSFHLIIGRYRWVFNMPTVSHVLLVFLESINISSMQLVPLGKIALFPWLAPACLFTVLFLPQKPRPPDLTLRTVTTPWRWSIRLYMRNLQLSLLEEAVVCENQSSMTLCQACIRESCRFYSSKLSEIVLEQYDLGPCL